MKIHATLRTFCGCERQITLAYNMPYVSIPFHAGTWHDGKTGERRFKQINFHPETEHLDAYATYLEDSTDIHGYR